MATMVHLRFLKISLTGVLALLINISSPAQLPSFYDLRQLNQVTPVKDQGSCGSCWAFATIASIESNWLKQGAGTYILSEDNIIDCHQFDEAPCYGGSFYMANALLSKHGGPLLLADDPYTPAVSNCAMNQTFPPLPPAFCEEFRLLPKDITTIKQAIYDHGAVASTMFFTMSNYNTSNFKYYDNYISSSDSLNAHGITIAGWNDTLTFQGAPGTGGWIIKDSYGTSWAQNGYFYVSLYDAGILSENAIFPVRHNIPPVINNSHVYCYDELGWVDNFGFANNTASALVNYTITPSSGLVLPQKIKRIGTYAVENNTTITLSVYKSFNSGVLGDLIGSTQIFCPFKGFYTAPFPAPAYAIGTSLYIKADYSCPSGSLKPIPVEIYEAGHTSGIQLSSGVCFVSINGSTWVPTGSGSGYAFDVCIKMYTENAQIAALMCPVDTVCEGMPVHLMDVSALPKDSIRWLIDDVYFSSMPAIDPLLSGSGDHIIKLVVFLGQNTDTCLQNIHILQVPVKPEITQIQNTLHSSVAYTYQWYENNIILTGETSQTFTPSHNGVYRVETGNEFDCRAMSDPFDFVLISNYFPLLRDELIYPNPCQDILYFSISTDTEIEQIEIFDITARNSFYKVNSPLNWIKLPESMNCGVYLLKITTTDNIYFRKLLKI